MDIKLNHGKYQYLYSYKKYGDKPSIYNYRILKQITDMLQKYTKNNNLYIQKIHKLDLHPKNRIIVIDNGKNMFSITYRSRLNHGTIEQLLKSEKIVKICTMGKFLICLCLSGKIFSQIYSCGINYIETKKIPIKEQVVDIKCADYVYMLTKNNKMMIYKYDYSNIVSSLTYFNTINGIKKIRTKKIFGNRIIKGILNTDNTLKITGFIPFISRGHNFIMKNIQDFKLSSTFIVFKRDDKYYHIGFTRGKKGAQEFKFINGKVTKYNCTDNCIVFITDKKKANVFQKTIYGAYQWFGRTSHKDIIDYHKSPCGLNLELLDSYGNCHYFRHAKGWKVRKKMKIYTQLLSLFHLCILYFQQHQKRCGKQIKILPKDIRKWL